MVIAPPQEKRLFKDGTPQGNSKARRNVETAKQIINMHLTAIRQNRSSPVTTNQLAQARRVLESAGVAVGARKAYGGQSKKAGTGGMTAKRKPRRSRLH